MIDISRLDKAEVLRALYNNSKPQGLGFLHFTSELMTREEAVELLKQQSYFDYIRGRVIKIDLSEQKNLDTQLYDRDNGDGAAQRAIDEMK